MSLIHNERTKLLANAIDRSSTACFAVGVLGQVFNLLPSTAPFLSFVSIVGWIFAAVVLHLAARRILGGLIP